MQKILKYYKNSPAGWFIAPRAFWPYEFEKRGVPGFHRFIELLNDFIKKRGAWDRTTEIKILKTLSAEERKKKA